MRSKTVAKARNTLNRIPGETARKRGLWKKKLGRGRNVQLRENAGANRPHGQGPPRRGPEKTPPTTGMEGALSRASHPARGCLGERRKGQPNSHTCARSRGAREIS